MFKKLIPAAFAAIACATSHAHPGAVPGEPAGVTLAKVRAVAGGGDPAAQEALDAGAVKGVSLKVAYADTLQGVSALYAVRVCAYDERSGAFPRLVESKGSPTSDIELQLVDEKGAEVSRYSGSKAVCDYARFAAAYAARVGVAKAEVSHE